MAPYFCVMCDALGHSACISGCHYAALVADGVINPLQLRTMIRMFKPAYVHLAMTSAAEEDRAGVIEWFWFYTRGVLEYTLEGKLEVQAKLAELVAETQKWEEEEEKEGVRSEVTALEADASVP